MVHIYPFVPGLHRTVWCSRIVFLSHCVRPKLRLFQINISISINVPCRTTFLLTSIETDIGVAGRIDRVYSPPGPRLLHSGHLRRGHDYLTADNSTHTICCHHTQSIPPFISSLNSSGLKDPVSLPTRI